MKTFKKLGLLKKRSEFLFVREGRYRAIGGVVIQARVNPEHKIIRVGFTATKKIGNAVIRNRAKRRLRQASRALLPKYGCPGHDYVFIARNTTVEKSYESLVSDVQKALINLAKPARK